MILEDLKNTARSHLSRAVKTGGHCGGEEDEDEDEEETVKTVKINVELEKFDKKEDWITHNTLPRHMILSILPIAYDLIVKCQESVTKSQWYDQLSIFRTHENQLPDFQLIAEMKWAKMRFIVSPMLTRYIQDSKKNDLRKFHSMYKDAMIVWRNSK